MSSDRKAFLIILSFILMASFTVIALAIVWNAHRGWPQSDAAHINAQAPDHRQLERSPPKIAAATPEEIAKREMLQQFAYVVLILAAVYTVVAIRTRERWLPIMLEEPTSNPRSRPGTGGGSGGAALIVLQARVEPPPQIVWAPPVITPMRDSIDPPIPPQSDDPSPQRKVIL